MVKKSKGGPGPTQPYPKGATRQVKAAPLNTPYGPTRKKGGKK